MLYDIDYLIALHVYELYNRFGDMLYNQIINVR